MSIVQLHLERSVDPERIDPVFALYTTPRLVSRRALALVAGSVLISIPALAKASPSYRRSSPAHHLADDLKPLLKRLRKRGYPDDLFQATAEALALVGVATYAAPSDSDPIIPITATPSPLRYLAWQVQSMATEIAARSGMTGADLDRLVDADANSIRPTALVWAYMTEIGSDGARLVRGLLGKDWWDDRDAHRFPALALAIATGDLLCDIDSARTVAAGMSRAMRFMDPVPGASYRTLSGLAVPLCSQVEAFVTGLLAGVMVDAEFATSPDFHSDFYTSLWTGLISAGAAASANVTDLTQDDIRAIVASVTTVVIATQVLSLVRPWSVSVEPHPARTRLGVGDEVITGEVTARIITSGQENWPADLMSCAAEAGTTLPPIDRAGANTHWETREEPFDLISEITVARTGESATADRVGVYRTNQESVAIAQEAEYEGTVDVTVSILRHDLDNLRHDLTNAIFPTLPEFITNTLVPVLGTGIATDLQPRLWNVAVASGTGRITVIYHQTPDATPISAAPGACNPLGDWAVEDVVQVIQAMADSVQSDVQFTYKYMTGSSTLEIRQDESFTWVFDQYTVDADTIQPDVGSVLVEFVFNGAFEGVVHLEETHLLIESQNHTLTVSAKAYLNGSFVSDMPIESEAWWTPGAAIAFKCSATEDAMTMIPTMLDISDGIIVRRLGT